MTQRASEGQKKANFDDIGSAGSRRQPEISETAEFAQKSEFSREGAGVGVSPRSLLSLTLQSQQGFDTQTRHRLNRQSGAGVIYICGSSECGQMGTKSHKHYFRELKESWGKTRTHQWH